MVRLCFGFTKKDETTYEPRTTILRDYSLLTDASIFNEIQCHLWFLRASYEFWRTTNHDDGQLSPWLLHTHPIAFVDGTENKDLRHTPDMYVFR